MAKKVRDFLAFDAITLRDELAAGSIRAIELTEACIAQIEKREPEVQAFAWFDADHAREQANFVDKHRSLGFPIGPLHGLPVGIKDIIDTAKVPTENGCHVDEGRVPTEDAYVVERVKAAGGIVMGKTVTTELAFMHPGKTTNPHNPAHTPGGSSQGSAAAVAAGMVPLAIGTQTGGSVIRPASFCGVTGFKPTYGAVPRRGILMQSPTLDTVGVFARTPVDAALFAEVLFGADAEDPATRLQPHPQLFSIASSKPPVPPVFGLVHPPGWDNADPVVHAAFAELADALGEQAFEVMLPSVFEQAASVREKINFAEMARYYYTYGRDGGDRLSQPIKEALASGNKILARDYLSALDIPKVLNAALEEIFGRCDAIICPAALGPAPEGLGSTGDSLFNGLWTLTGHPAVTLPLLRSSNDLPMGVQLVGERGNDARLLRTANWLAHWAATDQDG
jgi:Asp-tRNA(Asn)/Glu-tRNA(Gln) amidotransferase A subunit family amidase